MKIDFSVQRLNHTTANLTGMNMTGPQLREKLSFPGKTACMLLEKKLLTREFTVVSEKRRDVIKYNGNLAMKLSAIIKIIHDNSTPPDFGVFTEKVIHPLEKAYRALQIHGFRVNCSNWRFLPTCTVVRFGSRNSSRIDRKWMPAPRP